MRLISFRQTKSNKFIQKQLRKQSSAHVDIAATSRSQHVESSNALINRTTVLMLSTSPLEFNPLDLFTRRLSVRQINRR